MMIDRASRTLLALALLLFIGVSAQASEIGINDQRLSDMGTDGDPSVDAKTPAMAYNPTDNQILMIWSADAVDGHFQIWGKRVHAPTGAPAGPAFQISFSASPEFDAVEPDVVFNPSDLEYLVVWSSDVLNDGAEEIHGQRISRYGELVGELGFRISDMGTVDTDPSLDANTPAVEWNSIWSEYLVVWSGDDDEFSAEADFSIYGQRLLPDGSEIGTNDFAAAPVSPGLDFYDPDLAFNVAQNQYLLVFEAYLPAVSGPEIGGDVLGANGISLTPGSRYISSMGLSTVDDFHGKNPVVQFNAATGRYLVVWDGDHVTNEEFEIYGRWILPDNVVVDSDQIRLSDMGVDGDTAAAGVHPALAYDPVTLQHLVVWHGDDVGFTTADAEPEIFGQLFDNSLVELGVNDLRLSDMGPDPSSSYEAASATALFNPAQQLFLVGWSGDDDAGALASGEEEVYLQRWGAAATAVEDNPGPRRFALHANVPNPFNPSTTVFYDVPAGAGAVSLRIYDASGRLVRTLVNGQVVPGRRSVQWQGRDQSGRRVASGIYHLRMRAGEFSSTRKLALVQ